MQTYTDTCTTYKPTQTTTADGNVVPVAVALAASGIACNIHQDVPDLRERLTAIGIIAPMAAYLYAGLDDYSKFDDRYVVTDQLGNCWMVVGDVTYRGRFKATKHLRCQLVIMRVKPDGVP